MRPALRLLAVLLATLVADAVAHPGNHDTPAPAATAIDTTIVDAAIAHAEARLRTEGTTAAATEALALALIEKARLTRDDRFYARAIDVIDALPAHLHATDSLQLVRGHACFNLHGFVEAEAIARELIGRGAPPASYGLLCDALMEQGRLEEAVAACQRFLDLAPGPESYVRAALLRQRSGDPHGAIALFRAALRATSPAQTERRAWVLTQLAVCHLAADDAPAAVLIAQSALGTQPGYAPALSAASDASARLRAGLIGR